MHTQSEHDSNTYLIANLYRNHYHSGLSVQIDRSCRGWFMKERILKFEVFMTMPVVALMGGTLLMGMFLPGL